MEELFDVAEAFDRQPVPNGNRVAIMTNAGGPGILATDAADSMGLDVVRLDPATVAKLKANLPDLPICPARHDRRNVRRWGDHRVNAENEQANPGLFRRFKRRLRGSATQERGDPGLQLPRGNGCGL
jgi:hypothetical protein